MSRKDLLTVVLSVAAACVVAEAALRWSGLVRPHFMTYDRWRGWTLKPGASGWQTSEGRAWVRVNRWGYRGPDWSLKKAPHTWRIAVLGDSFTEAQQVPEEATFCAVAERVLNRDCTGLQARGVTHVEVLNFGVDGYGTAQELMTLRHAVWSFAPDVVVAAFFPGNDFRNNSMTLEGDQCQPFYVRRGGAIVLDGPFDDSRWFRLSCWARFESRHSQVLNVLGNAKSHLRWWWRGVKTQYLARRPAPAAGHESGLNDGIYGPPRTPVWRDAWAITGAELEMMHREAVSHGAAFVVVTLATGIQDSPNDDVRQRYMKSIGSASLFYPEQQIASWGEQDGFAVINLAAPMQQYAAAHQVYLHGFPNTRRGTGHWNEAGHQLAGQLIAKGLCALLDGGGGAAGTSRR